MADVLSALISKVSVVYIELMLPVLIVVGIWAFSHIRTDKQGKRYWFSAKYEANKSQGKLDHIIRATEHTQTDLLRLQLLQYFDHRPEEVETICHLYAEYKKRPEANGYIDRRMDEWRRKTGQGETT
ncbi:hypothetical protein AGMMS49940_05820 [Spirochaetia bacterium]|nr:hypothetical protein AGMMS49940_05820 [Spirochaetia bacterium]